MIKKPLLISIVFALLFTGCAVMQSMIKSTFPYTATLTIPASSRPGSPHEAIGTAKSFDQNFTKSGDNGENVSEVHMVSAKLRSAGLDGFNIGNLVSAKFYMSKPDGSDEVLVASRTDITQGVGSSMVLDIDDVKSLDQFVRLPGVRIRMVYVLRNAIDADASLHLVLGLSAQPSN